tara:strand:- start:70 stop:675 length:606 start_codon:yes stop_codon:yes gene_type:complete
MKSFSPALQDLIDAFKQLPGIGIKSAQRIVFYLLRENENKALFLAESIQKSFDSINECQECRMYTEEKLCSICTNSDRDRNIMCVVESPADLIAIENTMQFNGLYFVLMGRLSPLDGIGPDELKIEDLIKLLKDKDIKEIILANSPTIEGEATAAYIGSIAEDLDVRATRIAYGVPMGGELEYVDSNTLIQALNNRNLIGN